MSIEIKDKPANLPIFTAKTDNSYNTKISQQKQPESDNTATDKVNLTDMAKQLRKLSSSISAYPPVDNERIDSIKRAITTGEFNINPLRIADKLLSFENAISK